VIKITGGKYRGLCFKKAIPKIIRPTSAKGRALLFNVLREYINGADFLDIFAGTGIIGLEALSRGAGEVWFVEKDRRAIGIIKKYIEKTDESLLNNHIMRCGAEEALSKFVKKGKYFDIIFADPPYSSAISKILAQIPKIMKKESICVVEHYFKNRPPEIETDLVLYRSYRCGDSEFSFYKKT
jgi:16S rRNA (guanine(966)-N(2))-methyltransferase RsmD